VKKRKENTHTHDTKKVKLYSEMLTDMRYEITFYNSSTNTVYNTHDFSSQYCQSDNWTVQF